MPIKSVGRKYTRSGSEFTTLESSDGVICSRELPAKGSWERYRGRIGKVVSINVQRSNGFPLYVEIGVIFTRGGRVTWFRADELQPFQLPTHLQETHGTDIV